MEKSNALLSKRGVKDFVATSPMTLADIYNLDAEAFKYQNKAKREIGFLRKTG